MSDIQEIQQIDQLYEQTYKKLGRSAFVFISPTSFDFEIENFLPKFEKRFQKTYRKNKAAIDQFIKAVLENTKNEAVSIPVLEFEKENISELTRVWLQTISSYFQSRWDQGLPELAEYAIEFFIPPQTEAQKAQYKELGIKETDLKQTIKVDLPYAVLIDKKGEIDIKETINFENKFYLIKSKLAGLSILNYSNSLLANKLKYYPERAFFVINQGRQIEQIAEELIQRVFDNLMHLAYSDIERGISPIDAKNNALAQIVDMAQKRQLEELVVFRAREDMSMELYVLELLDSLREFNPKINQETLDDFYKHIFIALTEVIIEQAIRPGNFFTSKIREATQDEQLEEGNEYTLEIQSITNAGVLLEGIKEYYKFTMSEQALKDMLVFSTSGFRMDKYFL
ncbi:hypothetical protein JW978_02185 [Candidatus Dojkabacteria bacterium]|nr:hypothetical protein [Candidatus Dojkabacteria bacterium]